MTLWTLIIKSLARVDGPLWEYTLVFWLANVAGGSIGIICGSFAKDLREAALVLPVPTIYMLFFADIFIPLDNAPFIVRCLTEINPLFLVPRVLAIVAFSEVEPHTIELGKKKTELCEGYNAYNE